MTESKGISKDFLKPNSSAAKRRNSEVGLEAEDEIESIMKGMESDAVKPIDYLKTTFLMVKGISDKQNDMVLAVKKAEKRTDKIESRVDKLEKNLVKMEFENLSNAVIIRGLEMHANAQNRIESLSETREVATRVMVALRIQNQVSVVEATRFAASAQNVRASSAEPPKAPPVKVTFRNKNETQFFFKNLKRLKDTEFPKIAVTKEIPQSLMPKKTILEKAGYQIRQREETTKTRVIQRNFDLVLQKKPEGATEWEDVKVEIATKSVSETKKSVPEVVTLSS